MKIIFDPPCKAQTPNNQHTQRSGMKAPIILFAIIALVASSGTTEKLLPDSIHPSQVTKQHFYAWAEEHNSPYGNPDHFEHEIRYEIFKDNVELIHQHNQKDLSWKLGFGPFSAMTHEEFKSIYEMKDFESNWKQVNESAEQLNSNEKRAPASVDWRGKLVTGVKQQGTCGSCWSFSVAAAVEGCRAQAGKGLVRLSEQAQIDCAGGFGCGGWDPYLSLNWVKGNPLPTEKDYPYRANKGGCQNKPKVGRIGGYVTGGNSEMDLVNMIAGGVTSVSFQGELSDFMHYKSGVYNSAQCSGKITHAAVAVGYASNCAGSKMDCFIGKNSWGTGWGQGGFFLMARKGNRCAFTSHIARPTGCS